MPETRREPSAVIWSWRGGEADEQAQAQIGEAAAVRKRGAIGAVVGLTVAAALWLLWEKPVAAAVVAALALAFSLPALLAPSTAGRQVARALDRFAHAVGVGVTWVLMTLIYYLLFLPVGLFLRARKRLGITRSFDPRLPSYWTGTEGRARTPDSYRKQF